MRYKLIFSLLIAFASTAMAQLRTDGYSVYSQEEVKPTITSVSGWFALESLPTDTAAFIGVKNQHGNYVNVCVDHSGHLLLGESGRYTLLNTEKVACYKWYHLLIDLKTNSIMVNGNTVCRNGWKSLYDGRPLQLVAGKDFTSRHRWGFDQNVINGIINNVKADTLPVENVLLRADIGERMASVPRLCRDETSFNYAFSRSKYHLQPSANWTNESHGLLYFNGKYHIFHQKNASNILLRQINWGHFSSSDLIHWTEDKPVLSPGERYDQFGIWSGHAVVREDGIPEIIYTGGGDHNSINIAFPVDSSLINWRKYEANPVIADRPSAFQRTDMRDPYVFQANGQWYMIVGFGVGEGDNAHGALLLYRSADLKLWSYVHLLFEGNPQKDHSGVFWEMPLFYKLGSKWILSVNRVPNKGIPARTQYWTGRFIHEKFVPDHDMPLNLEVINRLLSPSVVRTPDGRTVAISIIPDEISSEANKENGWAHLFSIPREWSLKCGKICQQPLRELVSLRRDSTVMGWTELAKPALISKVGLQKEIIVDFKVNDKHNFGVTLCKSPDGKELTRIYFDPENDELIIDQTHSSLRRGIPQTIRKDHYKLDNQRQVHLHLFVDGSVIEGFINNEDAFTTRVFPSSEESSLIEVFSEGGMTQAKAIVYDLKEAKVKSNL